MKSMTVFFVITLVPFFGSAERLRVGLLSNFSSVSSSSSNPYGNYFEDGVKLALLKYKSRLLKAGVSIKFEKFDYGIEQMNVIDAAERASKSGIVAAIGFNWSSHALMGSPIFQKSKIPIVIPSATADRLSAMGEYVHLASFNNSFMAETLSKIAKERIHATRVASIVSKDCAYCSDLSAAFKKIFVTKSELEFVEIPILDSDVEFSTQIGKLQSFKPQAILVPNQELISARVIAAVAKAGFDVPFLGGDGWGNVGEQFFKILDGRRIVGFSTSHWHEDIADRVSKDFVRLYLSNYGRSPNDTSVLAYDSASLLFDGVLNSKTRDRAGIQHALQNNRIFNGVTGRFKFSGMGAPKKSLVVIQTDGRRYSVLERTDP